MELSNLCQNSYDGVPSTTQNGTKCPSRPAIVKNLVVLCVGTAILLTAYDALTMLQSTMNYKDGVGVISQAILYGFFCLSAILLPKICISKFGSKSTSLAAMFAYLPYIASNYYPHWILMIPSSVLLGIAGPLLWASHGVYLNEIALLYSIQEEPSAEKGKSGQPAKDNAKKMSYNEQTYLASNTVKDSIDLDYGKDKDISFLSSLKNTYDEQTYLVSNTVKDRDGLRFSNCKEPSSIPLHKKQNSIKIDDIQRVMLYPSNTALKNWECSQTQKNANMIHLSSSNSVGHQNSRKLPFERSSSECETRGLIANVAPSLLLISTTAKFFSFHGMAHLTSHIWSSLLSYFTLKTDLIFLDFRNSSCRCGAEFCSLVSECFESNACNPGANVRTLLTSICVCLCVVSILIVTMFLESLEQGKREIYFSFDNLSATCAILKRKEMLFLIPLSIHTGLVQGFYVGDFNKSYVACAWGTYHVGLVAVCYGSACGLSSLISGWCVRRCGRRVVFTWAALVNAVSVVFLLLWTPDAQFPRTFFYASGLWGTHVGIVWSQLRALYGVLFHSDDEAAFSAFHLWSGLGFCVAFGFSSFFCVFHKLYLILTVSVFGFTGYYIVESIYCNNNKDSH